MTTTGRPDQFLADPARGVERAGDPVVVASTPADLDGDDITVEPDAPRRDPRRRLLVGVIVVVLAAGGIAIAVASRHTTNQNVGALSVHNPQPHHAVAHVAAPKPAVIKPKPAHAHPVTPPAGIATPPAHIVTPVTNVSSKAVTPPSAPVSPPTSPPVTTPPAEPTSVLQWQATPATLSIKAGGHESVAVTVMNPTNGTVTLPMPLACAPTFRGPRGAVISQGVCAQITQVLAPHQRITQGYTVYATETGDASGKPLVTTGSYSASVEGLYNVKVNVTAG